jgi:2'-5' RNA ligase
VAVHAAALKPGATLRLFFACWPTPVLQRQLHEIGNRLKLQIDGRVSRSANIHLTLAFLGDVAADRLPVLQQLASKIVVPAFALPLQRLGCWPDGGIGWLAPDQAPEGLLQLVRQLNEALQRA